MPHLLFYEGGYAPSTRSRRELESLHRHGWRITVAVRPNFQDEVLGMSFDALLLPADPPRNLLIAAVKSRRDQLQQDLASINDQIKRLRESSGIEQLRARLDELRESVEALKATIQEHRQAGRAKDEAAARELLARQVAERTKVGEQIRTAKEQFREEVARLVSRRESVAAQIRAHTAALRLMTPYTRGSVSVDLMYLEPTWHLDAPILATAQADVMWAADLDALPPVIWASEAARNHPPVVFDAHELFTDLEYVPDIYKAAWRKLAADFVPLATKVVTVAEPIAKIIKQEWGARATLVVPNYAARAAEGEGELRARLGLPATTPLVIHIGTVTRYRNPGEIVNLLTDVPEIHVAFVGTASQTIVDEITSLAGSHGVAERLSFIPPVPLEQVTSAIADADVSVILYRSEGSRNLELAMPNKLFDSLAAGVPVVAPDGCAAGAFVAEQGLGRTFDIDTPGSLASAVRGVLQDPHLRSRVRARAAEFTWARAESTLLALVEELRNTGPEQDGQAPTAT